LSIASPLIMFSEKKIICVVFDIKFFICLWGWFRNSIHKLRHNKKIAPYLCFTKYRHLIADNGSRYLLLFALFTTHNKFTIKLIYNNNNNRIFEWLDF
jgi:hypothetical protein